MTNDEAIKTLREDYCGNRIICELHPDQCNREDCEIWLAIKALVEQPIRVLETQPDGDTISRQAAIDAVNQYNFDFPQYMERFVTELRDAMKADLKHDIEALPSTQPEITPDGTLNVSIDADIANVGRILLSQTGTQRGGLYYKDELPEPKWIPCKERLPDKDGLYLVTYFSGHARWTGTDEFLVDGTGESHWKYVNVIAWMPIPSAYQEEGDYA